MKVYTFDDLKRDSIDLFGDIFEFFDNTYVNKDTQLKIKCSNGHEYLRSPRYHLKTGTCPICSKGLNKRRLPLDEFIRRSKLIHSEDVYDYSLVEYVDNKTKVKIICKEHGIFEMSPYTHTYKKQKCQKCSRNEQSIIKRTNMDEFMRKSNNVHGEGIYDYSFVKYINAHTKVKIFCNTHKIFFYQTPHGHINSKHGCKKCADIRTRDARKSNSEEFINKSKLLHGKDVYDYSLVEYVCSKTPVILICNIHKKQFTIRPNPHLHKLQGCPYCSRSSYEIKIRILLDSLGIKYLPEFWFDKCRSKNPLPFDFAILNDDGSIKGLVEMQGPQHFEYVCFGGISKERAEENLKVVQMRDLIKKEYCEKNGIPLLCIHYSDINNIPKILPQFIRSLDDLLEAL